VVTRAGVTELEFSEEFTSEEGCFAAAFDHGQELLARILVAAVQDQKRWLTRVRAGLLSVLRFLDTEPQWAELLLVATPPNGICILERRECALARLAELLERGAPRGAEVGLSLRPGLTAELVIGGAFSVVRARLLRHRGMPVLELAPSLMSLVVLPYLGAAQANAELARKPVGRPQLATPNETKLELPRRASYRTGLVLEAIARAPRSNNRTIAAAAGLSDEGQTSKLLSRLKRQGLVENVGLGQAYGEANAWLLTAEGERVVQSDGQGSPQSTQGTRRVGRATCQS
jgi:hypothetical protein